MTPIEVEVTCPDLAVAHDIAEAAVAARLAACSWVIPGVTAIFRWQGKIDRGAEVLVRLKSRADLFEALAGLIRARHPYDLPALVALPVAALGTGVAEWWENESGAPGPDAGAQ